MGIGVSRSIECQLWVGQVIWRTTLEQVPTPSLGFHPGRDPMRVPIQTASASFSQTDWGVENAIDLRLDGKSGWGIGPGQGNSHEAIFGLDFLAPAGEWTLELWQDYGTQHTIGALRLATSAAPGELIALDDALAQVLHKPELEWNEQERSSLLIQARLSDPKVNSMPCRVPGRPS